MMIENAGPADFGVAIGLAGGGGAGKTFTALMLARAFAKGKAYGLIDTETGRGRRYYKHFTYQKDGAEVPYLYGQLEAPFEPERYIEAMEEMKAAGAAAIVIDSASHEWEGAGGILELHQKVTNGQEKLNMVGWAKVKPRHRRFIEFSKNTGVHVIMCFRAREKSKPNPNKNAPAYEKIISMGWQPITNEAASFEFDLFAMFEPNSKGKIADDANCKTFIEFEKCWRPNLQINPKVCDALVKAHAEMCKGAPEVKSKIVDAAPAADPMAEVEDDLPPADDGFKPEYSDVTDALKADAAPRNGLLEKIKLLADTQDIADVDAIEKQMNAHRSVMKPNQVNALERGIAEARSRLAADNNADAYAERIMDGGDTDQIKREVEADESLSPGDRHTLLTMIADHAGASAV